MSDCAKILFVGIGWTCQVISDAGPIELEQLDEAGEDWYAAGPNGEHIGALGTTLQRAAGDLADPEWLTTVMATIDRDRHGRRRSMLLARRGVGTWYHTTFAENRSSILAHGLDWTRMTGTGIAGSRAPETDGIFLCSDLDFAEWFAQMGQRRGRAVDIWAVTLDGLWLIGDPGAGGGGDDCWMICRQRIVPAHLKLLRDGR
jgi:hypothetical protein